jgi:DNA-binding NtrC family response regulator
MSEYFCRTGNECTRTQTLMNPSRRCVLCIDSDLDTGLMMQTFLGLEGFEVRTAVSLSEGLNRARNEHSDLYLMEFEFPDGTGAELCQQIRAFDPATPVIFCSGSAYPSQGEQAMRAGAYAYFVKPLDFECLLQTIAKSLNSVSNRSFAKASSY